MNTLGIIGVLSLLLMLSGIGNYNLYQDKVELKSTIAQKEKTIDGLQIDLNLSRSRVDTVDLAYSGVIKNIDESTKSFDQLTDNLKSIDCVKAAGKVNETPKTLPSADVDPIVMQYYDILHNAYRIQNNN